jgi:hypothetical protein
MPQSVSEMPLFVTDNKPPPEPIEALQLAIAQFVITQVD